MVLLQGGFQSLFGIVFLWVCCGSVCKNALSIRSQELSSQTTVLTWVRSSKGCLVKRVEFFANGLVSVGCPCKFLLLYVRVATTV